MYSLLTVYYLFVKSIQGYGVGGYNGPGTKLCPKKMCVYLISQLAIPVALINERLSEGHDPNDFHFMRYVRCPDVGVECLGYGQVMLKVQVIPRSK